MEMAATAEKQTFSMKCPACLGDSQARALERHLDPIEGKEYRLFLCNCCGAVFSEPRIPVSVEWYKRAHTTEACAQEGDWRYQSFLDEDLPRGRLLDIGCGAGQFLALAQASGFETAGLDFNPDYVSRAKGAGIKNVQAMDYAEFFRNYASGYDIVTLFDVLEHMPEPADFLGRIKRALRPEGYLAITVPNGDRPLLLKGNREGFDFPPYHFTRWTPSSLKFVLGRLGFKIIRVKVSPLPPWFFSGLFYYRMLNAVFPFLKRVLLGAKRSETEKTWAALLSSEDKSSSGAKRRPLRAWLQNPDLRQKLTDMGLKIFFFLCLPIEKPLLLWFRKYHPERGRTLYVLAQRK